MKLSITVISNRDQKPHFTQCLADLLCHTFIHANRIGIKAIIPKIGRQWSALPNGRQAALDDAIAQGSTHLLSIDDDMKFPPNTLEVMASRKVQAIGVNAVLKDPSERKFTAYGFNGINIDSRSKTGIEEVEFAGFGVFLLELSAVKNIPLPHFAMPWNEKTQRCDQEDHFLCAKLRNNGVKIYIDHDVSQHIGHVGDYVFTMNSHGK